MNRKGSLSRLSGLGQMFHSAAELRSDTAGAASRTGMLEFLKSYIEVWTNSA
jgi:hypothetical protein